MKYWLNFNIKPGFCNERKRGRGRGRGETEQRNGPGGKGKRGEENTVKRRATRIWRQYV